MARLRKIKKERHIKQCQRERNKEINIDRKKDKRASKIEKERGDKEVKKHRQKGS